MENQLISILIPFKNTSVFLPECIESIVSQKYQNWEIIAVDDHSSDNSLAILEHYTSMDTRIKVHTNKAEGIISALRTAYYLSKGELITRMDSDDIMNPNKLQILAAGLEKHGTGHVAIGGVQYFSDRGISNGYERYERWLNKLTSLGANYTHPLSLLDGP